MSNDINQGHSAEQILLTFQEAQGLLRVSHQTLYSLIRQGLPSHKVGRKRMFFREELIEWIKAH